MGTVWRAGRMQKYRPVQVPHHPFTDWCHPSNPGGPSGPALQRFSCLIFPTLFFSAQAAGLLWFLTHVFPGDAEKNLYISMGLLFQFSRKQKKNKGQEEK